MKCMYCGFLESKVLDSRSTDEGTSIRRRRECLNCGKRFTTYEIIENTPLMVIKSDGIREQFDPSKIKRGIIKSCEKRSVPMEKINALVSDIEKQLYNSLEQEVTSKKIGDLVMTGLKDLDEVAYIRFAAVYRQFKDIATFTDFIREFELKLK